MNSSTDKSNGLMGDLESIKALLEEDELEAIPESLSEALNPLPIKDTAEDKDAAEESADDLALTDSELEQAELAELEGALDAQAPDSPTEIDVPVVSEPVMPSNLEALLGEEFHEATAEVMQRARGLINQHANRWSPQQTDELADALRVRIDAAVAGWIKTSLDAHALELQQRLLNAVRDELARHLEAFEHSSE